MGFVDSGELREVGAERSLQGAATRLAVGTRGDGTPAGAGPSRRTRGLGSVEGVTHDDVRHGTTTLFAALDIAHGQVLRQNRDRHRNPEFLGFLRRIDKNVPEDLEVHGVLDNYSTHKQAKVKGWLASHPRFHVHFTPTYASWLNQVERWFGIITQRAIRRLHLAPYLEKLGRLCKRVSGTGH